MLSYKELKKRRIKHISLDTAKTEIQGQVSLTETKKRINEQRLFKNKKVIIFKKK